MTQTLANARILVTGGAGFIGSAVVRHLIARHRPRRCQRRRADLCREPRLAARSARAIRATSSSRPTSATPPRCARVFETHRPDAVMHLAAESHVDRSIDGPAAFIHTNSSAPSRCSRRRAPLAASCRRPSARRFRFLHISTDEVFGSLGPEGLFTETTPYGPNSPYSASKAASDHLVRAWRETYGLPVLVTNCSNNYGPYHFPEKLIPLMILNGLEGEPLPVYGDGGNVRDWLYVEDHARALALVLETRRGRARPTTSAAAASGRTSRSSSAICDAARRAARPRCGVPRRELISFVADRPGHDLRYAIDPPRSSASSAGAPQETFESGPRARPSLVPRQPRPGGAPLASARRRRAARPRARSGRACRCASSSPAAPASSASELRRRAWPRRRRGCVAPRPRRARPRRRRRRRRRHAGGRRRTS